MSRSLLAQGSRHLPPWLILGVRSISSHFIEMHRQMNRYRTVADAALLAGSARIFAGSRIDWLGLAAFPCSPGEQTRRSDPTPTKQIGAGRLANSLLHISHFGRGVDARLAQMTTESRTITRSPNKAMVPTPVNVTIPADARIAPFTSAAHLDR